MSGSSLKFFADAKACIGELGSNLYKSLLEEKEFLKNTAMEELLEEGVVNEFEVHIEKVRGVLDIVKRNSMKVVFFGRTSNGKSTVVNAMLRNKILPSGLGHTTNCFVQIEGVDGDEASLVTEDGEVGSIHSLKQLASALSERRLSNDSLIRIKWPKHRCKLLQEDVVFVDSPGIDLSGDMDGWIEKFCLDADVFVLVVNAESTLMQTEKNFFHRVSSRLSKPNIFILNNRWDASSHEQDSITEVRQQHVQRCSAFLVDELQCTLPHQLPQRLFFVSAIETLARSSSSEIEQKEGYRERLQEFEAFEDSFEQCISKAAVSTKFSQHVSSLHMLNSKLLQLWTSLWHEAMRVRNARLKELSELTAQLSHMKGASTTTSHHVINNIHNTSQQLSHRMNTILRHELDNLPCILDDFHKACDFQDPHAINNFKRDLNFYVEECLTRNLHLRYTPLARNTLCDVSKQLIDAFSSLLPESKHADLKRLCPPKDFEVVYNLECSRLCATFQADLRFHFSLGISALFQRFTGSSLKEDEWSQLICSTAKNPSLLPLTSPSSLAALSLLALVSRVIGMRVIATCAVVYVLLYAYERVTWGDQSRIEAYKQQYCRHANHQINSVLQLLCASCSKQVESELVYLYNGSNRLLGVHEEEVEGEVEELKRGVDRLEGVAQEAKNFSSRHEEIDKQLDVFKRTYNL